MADLTLVSEIYSENESEICSMACMFFSEIANQLYLLIKEAT